MNLRLRGKRGYWLAMGVGAVLLLILLFIWIIPAQRAAVQAGKDFAGETMRLTGLRMASNKIPSMESLKALDSYRNWVKDQARLVESFFADRATLLEAPLTGEGDSTPVGFKEAYLQAVTTQRAWLQNHLALSDSRRAFPAYAWAEGTGAPKPEEYVHVLRDYWARVILYHVFLDGDVKLVKRLELGRAVSLSPEFEAMPLQTDLTLPSDGVGRLVEMLLTVSPTVSGRPIINLTRMALQPEIKGRQALCSLQLDGYILLLKRDGMPGKTGGAKP